MIEVFFENVLEISLTISPILLILLLISRKISTRYRAKWKYWAWLVIALRLVIPLNISLPFTPVIETSSIRQYQPAVIGHEAYYPISRPADASTVETDETKDTPDIYRVSSINLLNLGGIIYAGGLLLFFFFHMLSYHIFLKRVKRWSFPDDSAETAKVLRSLQSEMSIKGRISIYRCSEIDTPMMAGLFHPMILLPAQDEFTQRQLEIILRHELVHYKRLDLWYKLLQLMANAIHWFNPLVYLAVKQAAYDLEASCDSAVLQEHSPEFRLEYGETMLGVMRGSMKKRTILSTYFSPGKKSMKQRFENILDSGNKHRGTWALVLLAACVIVTGTLVACSHGKEKPDIQVQASLKSLTEKEYTQVGTAGIEQPVIDDFKRLYIQIDAQNITNRTIYFPSVQEVSSLLTLDIYWYGNYTSQDNASEDFAYYCIDAVLYTRNTTLEEIRNKLNNLKIDISYENEQGKVKSETYSLGDLLVCDEDFHQPASEKADNGSDAVSANDALPVNEITLSSTPSKDHINIMLSPTSFGTDSYYYAVSDQHQLSWNEMTVTKVSHFPNDAYLLGISIISKDQQWALLSDGTFYRFEDKGLEADCFVGEDTELFEQILQILKEELGFVPLDPSLITGIAAAELSYIPMGSDHTYVQRMEDPDKLLLLEKLLSNAKPGGGLTACPFNETLLTLELADGSSLQMRLATDSCPIYFANGVCFDYGKTNEELQSIFNEIPWKH